MMLVQMDVKEIKMLLFLKNNVVENFSFVVIVEIFYFVWKYMLEIKLRFFYMQVLLFKFGVFM